MPQGFIDISLTGDKELQHALDLLEKKDAKRITRQATRAGAKHLHQQVLRAIPVKSGLLKALMSRLQQTVKAVPRNRRGWIGFRVETPPRSDFPENTQGIGGNAYYPAHLEYGRKDGSVPPHPYIRDTTEEARSAVLSIFAKKMREGINRFAAKMAAMSRRAA